MSKMTWFKLHSEFRNDPKVKRLPIAERYAFIILLCLASEAETRGVITGLDDDDIAFELEMQVEDWKTLKAKFKVKGFIDFSQDEILIRNWDKRQYDKPSDHPEATRQRKRLQRERDKLAKSQDVTPCHADVTPMSRGRLDKTRSEEIRSDQTRSDPHINNSCVRVHEEISSNQVLVDRIEKAKLLEQAKWTPPEIDCRTLAKDDEFAEYIRAIYLPTTAHYLGKQVEISAAKSWIIDGFYDPAKRLKVEIQLEAFETWRSRQQKAKSATQNENNAKPRLLKPNPITWTDEQKTWSYDQWEKYLHEQNTSNASIYANY